MSNTNQPTAAESGCVIDLFHWHEQRANARATAARERHRANPLDADAERESYETMTGYIRAARQRNEAERRRRQHTAQSLANTLRDGSYQDPRPGGR